MEGIIRKLYAVSGMLELLSCMEGCTVTSQMTTLLVAAVETLDDVEEKLAKMEGK